MKQVNKVLDKFHVPHWLCAILALVFVLRIPSFFEPFTYGDEMIYLTLGEAIKKGLILYKDIHDNKPPLLYFMASIAGNVFWFRAILAFWMLATITVFWKLTRTLFPKKENVQKVSVVAFAVLTTLPLLEGQIANAELFMIGFTILAFWLLLEKGQKTKNILTAGIFLGLATLFKVPAAFDAPAIVFYWLATSKLNRPNILKLSRKSLILLLGFVLPIVLTFAWYATRGALSQYFTAGFGQNIGYLSSFRPEDVREPFWVRNGPLLTRAGLVAVAGLTLFVFRKKISRPFLLATIWLFLSLFAITLSERPYPHYLIQFTPSVAILIGILARPSKEQVLTIIPLFFAILAPVYYNFWYYPSLPYYTRFWQFATGQISQSEYFARFEGQVERNYQIADFIIQSTRPDDKIFVWGSNAAIYALSRRLPPIRYVADYHINDFSSQEEVVTTFVDTPPEVIVVLPEGESFRQLDTFLVENYFLINNIQNVEIWKLK